MRETLTYLEGIRFVSRSKNNFALNYDLLASVAFSSSQYLKIAKMSAKQVLELLPSIDM